MKNGYHLNETQHRIYNYIIDSLQRNHKPTVTEVAEQNYVSTTYVVKVAKQLGYDGYSEFLHVSNWLMKTSVSHDESEVLLLNSILKDDISYLADLIMSHAENLIFIVGVGYSEIAAAFFIKKFTELGVFCYDGSPFDMKVDHPNSLVLFISRSGETDDILRISRKLDNRYNKVLLTTNSNSSIGETVDKVILISDESHDHVLPIPDLFLSKVIMYFEYVYNSVRLKNK